ncbi:MAG: hypothetical protein M1824_000365 [Vezdaea acicularis]|nr:MAG: hypothetical protein M1824_000365 [Vezdaea acicularis]
MPTAKKKRRFSRPNLLSNSRPSLKRPQSSMSSKTARTIIRSHHYLRKKHALAVANGDVTTTEKLQNQIEARGGLKKYQQASIIGQSKDRGGDSSKVLMDWLKSVGPETNKLLDNRGDSKLRLLEVGALTPNNACSKPMIFEITRIDLHSQHPSIESQDFMERPLPSQNGDMFDIISLSLVLNYVPEANGRGEMLRRTANFLRQNYACDDGQHEPFPCLFLVLPAPCVTNSRYLDEDRLGQIMQALGYRCVRSKLSDKLFYSLWSFHAPSQGPRTKFKKIEVNPGRSRNNFAVILS